MSWIQDIYRNPNYREYSKVHKYPFKKFTGPDGRAFHLPKEFIKFLGPHWEFIYRNPDILDALENPEKYNFIDIVKILEALPKDDIEAQRFHYACLKFGLVNRKILDIFDIPYISTPDEFHRFLETNDSRYLEHRKEIRPDLSEAEVRNKWPDAQFYRYSNVVFAERYDGYEHKIVYCKKFPHSYITVHSNGTSVISEGFLSRYHSSDKVTISRRQAAPVFLNRAFSNPYTRLESVQAQQDFISQLIDNPRLRELRELFESGIKNLIEYSMLIYPVDGHCHHDAPSGGESICSLYHNALLRDIRQKTEIQRLYDELKEASPEAFESFIAEEGEFGGGEGDDKFSHRIFRSKMNIYDPEDPFGTQEYFMEKYAHRQEVDENDIQALEKWVNDPVARGEVVDINLKQVLDDGYQFYDIARQQLISFFQAVADIDFPFLRELEIQSDSIFMYFGERYLYRKGNQGGNIEYGELKEFDIFMQNLGILQSLFAFIDIIISEEWSKTRIEAGIANGYTNAWNYTQEKQGQVCESLEHGGSVKIFSSPNTSGKSFLLKRDAGVQMAAQSMGYAPAERSQIGKAVQAIFFFDRPDNQVIEQRFGGRIGRREKPSAFMYEILSIIDILKNNCQNSLSYLDEVCTTTGALDQAAILCALIEYLHTHQHDMIMSTHNELLLQFFEDHGIDGIPTEMLHLGYEDSPFGPKNTYNISPGRSDSLFLEVCRREQAPSDFIHSAQRYLDGDWEIPQEKIQRTPPKIQAYSSEQREGLSQDAQSIMHLFPHDTTFSILKLYSKNGDLQSAFQFTQDHLGLEDKRRKFRDRKVFLEGVGADSRYYEMLQRLIFHTPELSSQETLERQKMFASLQTGINFHELSHILQKLSLFDDCMMTISQSEREKNINTDIFDFLGVVDYEGWIKKCEEYKQQSAEAREDTRHLEHNTIGDFIPAYVFMMGYRNDEHDSSPLNQVLKVIALNKKILGERASNSTHLEKTIQEILDISSKRMTYSEEDITEADIARLLALQDTFNTLLRVYISSTPSIPYGELIQSQYSEDLGDIIKRKNDDTPGLSHGNLKGQKHVSSVWEALYHVSRFPEKLQKLKDVLQDVDSVYIHQSLNYLNKQGISIQNGTFRYRDHSYWQEANAQDTSSNSESLSQLGASKTKKGSQRDSFGEMGLNLGMSRLFEKRNTGEIQTELLGLTTVLYWAYVIKKQGFGKVRFHEKNEIQMKNLAHLNHVADSKMVRNDVHIGGNGPQVPVLTGPNGSGKTFFEQSVILGLMSSLSTGYGPGKHIRIPLIDKALYLERVMEENKQGLSAGANEIRYWKEIYRELETSRCPIFIGDEILSVTSPRYQEAGTVSVLDYHYRNDILGIIATHNHQAIGAINTPHSPFQPFHFTHVLDSEGHITYQRNIQPGHAPSLGIEVAEKMGLDPKIIARAKYFRKLLAE